MKKIELLKKIKKDLINKTSYSIDYLADLSVDKTVSEKGIKIRKIFSPLLRFLYSSQSKYKLIKEKKSGKIQSKNGKIFVVNHRQADDIVLGVNAIGEDGYIVFGNKNLVLDTTNGLGLWAYGMIMLDREDKNSRHKTYEKMKFIIEHGGNIIIFPEGYWNLDDNGLSDYRHGSDLHNSESWLIQDINIGVIRLSQETSCPIIPTILHYDEFKKKSIIENYDELTFIYD